MSASNDKLLFDAAKIGDLKKVKDLLSKGARTGFVNEVNKLTVFYYCPCFLDKIILLMMILMLMIVMMILIVIVMMIEMMMIMMIILLHN